VVDQLIAHTPTNLDAFMLKARILKHAGEYELAHTYMDQARRMDTADRYLNTKCTRYALRAGHVETAEETVSLFLREGDGLISLVDMQCSWYENECGATWKRSKEYGKALKQYVNVTKHFHEMEEDQFDFHSYCLRKMTLRSYVKMMRMEDKIRSHRFFLRASRGAVQVYLELYDAKALKEKKADEASTEIAAADVTPAEKKRLAKKAKREAARKAKAEADENAQKKETKTEEKKVEEKPRRNGKEPEKDPNGELLLNVEDLLAEADKFAKELLLYSPEETSSHLLACEVYRRRKKYLLWLRSLQFCLSASPTDAAVKAQHVLFLHNVATDSALPESLKKIIETEMPSLSKGAKVVLSEWIKADGSSVPHALAAAKCMLATGDAKGSIAVLQGLKLPKDADIAWKDCAEVLSFLQEQSADAANAFKELAHSRFPVTPNFMSDEQTAGFQKQHEFKDMLETYILPPAL